jgi:hypothetical protein
MRNGFAVLLTRIAATVVVAGITCCNYLNLDACIYEIRSVEGAGPLSDGENSVLYARLNVRFDDRGWKKRCRAPVSTCLGQDALPSAE